MADFVVVNAADGEATGNDTTVTHGTLAFAAGNLVIVAVRWDGGGAADAATATLTDTAGNVYQLIGYMNAGGSEDTRIGLWYCLSVIAHATNQVLATLSSARSFKYIFVRQYSYTGSIQLGDTGSGSNSVDDTTLDTSPALAAVAGDLVVGWFGHYNDAPTFTPDAPFTTVSSIIYAKFIEHIVATPGNFTPGIDATGSGDSYAALTAVFEDLAGGGGGSESEIVDHAQAVFQGQSVTLRVSAPLIAAQAVFEGQDVLTLTGGSVNELAAFAQAAFEGQQILFVYGVPGEHAEAAWQGGDVSFSLRYSGSPGIGVFEGQDVALESGNSRTLEVEHADAVWAPSVIGTTATGIVANDDMVQDERSLTRPMSFNLTDTDR